MIKNSRITTIALTVCTASLLLSGCAPHTSPTTLIQNPNGGGFNGFLILKDPGSLVPNGANFMPVYFTKNGDKWSASATGDLSNESVELLITSKKKLGLEQVNRFLLTDMTLQWREMRMNICANLAP